MRAETMGAAVYTRPRMDAPRVFISVGELSGDIAGARLIAEIRRREPAAFVFGTGGPRMAAAGAAIESDTNDIGVVGVTEVVRTLPAVAGAYWHIRRRVRNIRPDVAVLIGNDVFNVLLARWLKRRRVPTVSYFPPQVWLWRSLAGPIARSFDAIAASFPLEFDIYTKAGVRTSVAFVGHYLASDLAPARALDRGRAREQVGVAEHTRVVGLLPGSRRDEISLLAPLLLDTAESLLRRDSGLQFLIAATEATADRLDALVAQRPLGACVKVSRDSHAVMRSADLLLIASGTASLEAALLGTPMVIVYKVSPLTNFVAKVAVRAGLVERYAVGLPNLILDRTVVPEVLQEQATAPVVADTAWNLLSSQERLDAMRHALSAVGPTIRGEQPLADVADLVLALARQRASSEPMRRGWQTTAQSALGLPDRK